MWKETFGRPIGFNRQIFWFGFGLHLFRTARASSIRVDLKSGERGMCAVVRKAVRADRRVDRKFTNTLQGFIIFFITKGLLQISAW